MAFNYNFDLNTFTKNMLPPNKRLSVFEAFMRVIVKPLQWLHDNLFTYYKEGTSFPDYNALTAYVVGDYVTYKDKGVYYCIAATTGNAPGNTTYWYKIQDVFLGISERIQYQPQILVFEWALNRFFGQTFVNPPSVNPIYIQTNAIDVNTFFVGTIDFSTAQIPLSLGNNNFIGDSSAAVKIYSFTINYPTGLPASLGLTTNEFENLLKQQADKIKAAGTLYDLNAY